MQSDTNTTVQMDGAGILVVLAFGVLIAVGFSLASSQGESKNAEISKLQSELYELQRANDACRWQFQGYKEGRR